MTKNQRIAALEREVSDLRRRLDAVEARPLFPMPYPVPVPVYPAWPQPVYPAPAFPIGPVWVGGNAPLITTDNTFEVRQ